jgi:predicted transcriptional regulator
MRALGQRPRRAAPGGPYVKTSRAYDHWHRSEKDRGRPYEFTTPMKLLQDFFTKLNACWINEASPMTYKIGTIGEFARWTQTVVADPAAARAAPKRWFDSKETAQKALGIRPSPEALIKLLSPENLALLRLIGVARPASVIELAALAHRAAPNLSRTLKKLREAGIVDFERGPGKMRAPRVTASRVTLDLDLQGSNSSVSVSARRKTGSATRR